ncbi:hypothetical protein HOLleu_15704 [Holothuria leucospilota]|uniref:Reverse transcriptase/retrotransposon-derived protein RNase H-like domain-containing protein n=1 Tax=Holothuria leucospilota TaxID=206669 RepID=A0A9Q1C5K2_HOLLE|nr:hypothetical protein HOLleu_15704 [Holothuria leucospilota]
MALDRGPCFNKLTKVLCEAPLLAYYDENKELTLSVDVSSKGLGATLLQKGQPIAYATKALTNAETNYSQIEKELLAIVWGCKRFPDYVAFRKVLVESDHRPLESVMKKPLYEAPLCLQSLLMQLQHYDVDVRYRKGEELYIADTHSRAYLPNFEMPIEGPLEVSVVKELTPISSEKFEEFKRETAKDPNLAVVCKVIQKGWPEQIKECPVEAKPYWTVRNELTVVDGVVFKSSIRIIVPHSLRKDMLSKIHEVHQGIVRESKRNFVLARDNVPSRRNGYVLF